MRFRWEQRRIDLESEIAIFAGPEEGGGIYIYFPHDGGGCGVVGLTTSTRLAVRRLCMLLWTLCFFFFLVQMQIKNTHASNKYNETNQIHNIPDNSKINLL